MAETQTSTSFLTRVKGKFDLHTLRQATGLLHGPSTSVFKGTGIDFDDLAYYQPGDDVGDIDWKASAHSGLPLIKRYVEYRNRNICFVVDTGRAMAADTSSGEPKREVAVMAGAFLAHVALQQGDVIGLIYGNSGGVKQLPARSSSQHFEMLLRSYYYGITPENPPSDLALLLHRAFSLLSRKSLVVVFTDAAHPSLDDTSILRRLTTRHEVIFVTVTDADATDPTFFERSVREIGEAIELPEFVRRKAELHDAFGQLIGAQRAEAAATLRRLRIESVPISREDDVVTQMTALLRRKRHAGR